MISINGSCFVKYLIHNNNFVVIKCNQVDSLQKLTVSLYSTESSGALWGKEIAVTGYPFFSFSQSDNSLNIFHYNLVNSTLKIYINTLSLNSGNKLFVQQRSIDNVSSVINFNPYGSLLTSTVDSINNSRHVLLIGFHGATIILESDPKYGVLVSACRYNDKSFGLVFLTRHYINLSNITNADHKATIADSVYDKSLFECSTGDFSSLFISRDSIYLSTGQNNHFGRKASIVMSG